MAKKRILIKGSEKSEPCNMANMYLLLILSPSAQRIDYYDLSLSHLSVPERACLVLLQCLVGAQVVL